MSPLIIVSEAFLLALAISMDAFAASFAYGSKGIKITLTSNLIIAIICSLTLALSLILGAALRQYIPAPLAVFAGFILLFFIGLIKLLDSITKSIIRRYSKLNKGNLSKKITFSMFNFSFILNLYANPIEADIDGSKTITSGEAALLAVSLSLDSLVVGFGAALSYVNVLLIFSIALLASVAAVFLGCASGKGFKEKTAFDVTWAGGFVLIVLAVSKLF